ncbi:MAG: BolA family transcriptional regulator, partial [Candidatus Omnitrophica bacterium]|nr:BolA family transcriptional regulator [Candidatus Omnitrophota bacterium]
MMKAKIEQLLAEAFVPDFLEVIDESRKHAGHAGASQGGHYRVILVAKSFKGMKPLEIHRLIYQALAPVKSSI